MRIARLCYNGSMTETETETEANVETDSRQWVTIQDAARILGCPEVTLYWARQNGHLAWQKRYGRYVIDLDEARERYGEPEIEPESEVIE